MVCSILFNLLPQLVVFKYYTDYYILVFVGCQFLQTQTGGVYEVIVELNLDTIIFGGDKTKSSGTKYNARQGTF
jgi:hypothetical protein